MATRDQIFRATLAGRHAIRQLVELAAPKPIARAFYRLTNPDILHRDAYIPLYRPYVSEPAFKMRHLEIRRRSLVGPEALWTLQTLATQCCNVPGDFIEAGVYRGGTAKFLRNILDKAPAKTLRLFDTFSGMPTTDSNADFHKQGDFADTNLEDVKAWIGADRVSYHPGFIPETFAGLEDERFAFAHVDVDIRQSVLDCCVFIYPRMIKGGVMVFDDYGLPTCPGARMAVDEFFAGKPEQPLALSSGQAVIFKICDIN